MSSFPLITMMMCTQHLQLHSQQPLQMPGVPKRSTPQMQAGAEH